MRHVTIKGIGWRKTDTSNLLLLGALASWAAYHSYSKRNASNDWPLVSGQVIATRIDSSATSSGDPRPNSTSCFPSLVYKYEVNGAIHDGWRIACGSYSSSAVFCL